MKKNGTTDKVNGKKENDAKVNEGTTTVYNLIILDESGSMDSVRMQTISGCNETLNSIRTSAKEHEEIKQMVSIYCFDSENPRYIRENVPVEEVRNITVKDYEPNAMTPLYDAIGKTVTELRNRIADSGDAGMVTIITDGYENFSKEWSHGAVVKLIADLKAQGWVFTFIGANIDVKATASALGIMSYMSFEFSEEGMHDMWQQEQTSRKAYYGKRAYVEKMKERGVVNESNERELLCAMNSNFFTEEKRVTPHLVKRLKKDEVFVFGSDAQGAHQGGAALYAVKHLGAVVGQAEGPQGQSYGIPTVGVTFEELKHAVERFTDYVVQHPEKTFLLTAVGCGKAGYSAEQIAPLFRDAYSFGNVYVPQEFLAVIEG